MKTAFTVIAAIGLTIVFEVIYEWIAAKLLKPKARKSADFMEDSINDGCQTSIRLLGFGLLASVIAWIIL